MKKDMTIHLTEEDIEDAKRFGFDNVLLSLISSRTGTLWCLIKDGPAVEIMEPYRSLRLYYEEDGQQRPFCLSKDLTPRTLKAELLPLDPQNPHPQCEVFAEALRQFEPSQERMAELANRFFAEYAFEKNGVESVVTAPLSSDLAPQNSSISDVALLLSSASSNTVQEAESVFNAVSQTNIA